MPIERFFDLDLEHGDSEGKLTGDEMHHALRVFRLKSGDKCEIINGRGLIAEAQIDEISKKEIRYMVMKQHQDKHKSSKIQLICGMPKFARLEVVIEKICELGCDEIILFNADRSEKTDLSKNQLERLTSILQAALKQCGRLYFPHLEFRPHLENCFDHDRKYYFGDLHIHKKLHGPLPEKVGFIIGPESGFSDSELKLLKEKAEGISLSNSVLRADTAAITAVCLMSYL